MALAQPKCSGFRTDAAPLILSGRMMEPPPTRIRSASALETFMASTLSSTRERMTAMAFSATSWGMAAARDASPSSTMPRRTAMSVAVITSPPKTRAFLVIS